MNSRSGSQCFTQNALPFPDQAGEHYFDYANSEIYYKPKRDITRARILAPRVRSSST